MADNYKQRRNDYIDKESARRATQFPSHKAKKFPRKIPAKICRNLAVAGKLQVPESPPEGRQF
jgi:hypothetical protein